MLLGLLLLYFTASKSQGRQPASGARSSTPPVGSGRQVPVTRTGEDDFAAWVRHRLALAVVTVAALEVEHVDDVAIALVAQWAHETGKGKAEFNFNLGGWTARKGDDFHTANDALTGSSFRWTAYPDLPTAVDDQVKRLRLGFPHAWALLNAAPLSSEWIEELGRAGYYTADPTDYARAWQALDAEVRSLPR